jgi:hypothetical protein
MPRSRYQGANTLVNNHSALQAAAALGLHVTFERGHATGINDPNRSYIPQAAAAAKAADVAVVFIGLSTLGKACEGEEHDRGGTTLPGAQEPLLEAVLTAQPRTVVVLIGGGSLSVEVARHCEQCAVIYAYYPGELGGDAMINTIVGSNNPSGRLPYTLYPSNMTTLRKINDYDLRSYDGLTYKWYLPPGTGNKYVTCTHLQPDSTRFYHISESCTAQLSLAIDHPEQVHW